MSAPGDELLQLAFLQFGRLTGAERRMLLTAASGDITNCLSSNSADNDLDLVCPWGDTRTIRAHVLRWLCANATARLLVDPAGIRVVGASLQGVLDLAHVSVPFPIVLSLSVIPATLDLTDAQLGSLMLRGSHCATIKGDHATFSGYVWLDQGFHATGEVRLCYAEIGGQFTCQGGRFEHPDGDALNCDRLTVKGDVFLTSEVGVTGRIRFVGAVIGSNLECVTAVFGEAKRSGLVLERAVVSGTLLWQDVTCAPSTVLNLEEARIGMWRMHDPACWPAQNHLFLNGLIYDAIDSLPDNSRARRAWTTTKVSLIKLQPGYTSQPYEQLIAVLRRVGHEVEARDIAIAKQEALRESGGLDWWSWIRSWILGITSGYGYRLWRPVAAGILLMAFGTLVFWYAFHRSYLVPSDMHPYANNSPWFNPIVYSVDTFLPVVDFTQQSHWQPNATHWRGWMVQAWYWVEIGLGWIISSLFLLGFTNLVRKD
jgi:hypothetical protein